MQPPRITIHITEETRQRLNEMRRGKENYSKLLMRIMSLAQIELDREMKRAVRSVRRLAVDMAG